MRYDIGSGAARTYYDIPMLKAPVWSWEIAPYFFLGGLSAGAYTIARMAERFGGERYGDVTRAGTFVSAAAAAPCPLLLISDLGDPKRFHHMLRVFKPSSPMNLGAWALTGYSGLVALATLRELARRGHGGGRLGFADNRMVAILVDAVGTPLALLMAGYAGALLSATSIPIWSRHVALGALFSASAFHTGAAAISLALEARGGKSFFFAGGNRASERAMKKVKMVTRVAESAALGAYLSEAGKFAAPLTGGKYAPLLWGGAVGAGLLAPLLIEKFAPRKGNAGRWLRIGASALGLAGGLALRWAIVKAGTASAKDPQAARTASGDARQGADNAEE